MAFAGRFLGETGPIGALKLVKGKDDMLYALDVCAIGRSLYTCPSETWLSFAFADDDPKLHPSSFRVVQLGFQRSIC